MIILKILIVIIKVILCLFKLNISVSPLSNDQPKSLLPILNKPILAYQLEFFERNKFKNINLITHKKYYSELDSYISEKFKG
jgi:NDP-sugar pyrophosphorylase family protein